MRGAVEESGAAGATARDEAVPAHEWNAEAAETAGEAEVVAAEAENVAEPDAATIDSLVALGLQASPTLAAIRERILASREMSRSAGAPPDPMAGFTLSGMKRPGGMLGEEPMSVAAFELSQSLAVPGKLRARREAAEGETAVLEAKLSAARRDLVARIREDYARLFALDHEVVALRSTAELLEFLSSSAVARYRTGEGDLSEPSQIEVERARIREKLDDLSLERVEALARLNALLDRGATTPIRTGGVLPGLPPGFLPPEADPADPATTQTPAFSDLIEQALSRSAEIRMARAEVEAAERKVRAARISRWPDLTAGAEYGYRGGLDPMVSARVGLEIPVWKGRKQDAEVRAAEHELRSMTEELRAETAKMRSEAAAMLVEILVADRQARRFQEEIVPNARLTSEARRAAYATGRSDVNDMIEAVRMQLMAEADAARRQADRFGAWARWQAMTGLDPLPEGDSR